MAERLKAAIPRKETQMIQHYDNEKLAAKIKAVNLANATANRIKPHLTEIFKEFVGRRITKKDHSLLANVKEHLPASINDPNIWIDMPTAEHFLCWAVRASVGYSDIYVSYHELNVYIGSIENHVLVSLSDQTPFRTDYTLEEIIAKRQALADAKKALSQAQSALYPFDEYWQVL